MSFFEKTATGSIVNRFSQDMNLIDTELPVALLGIFCSMFVSSKLWNYTNSKFFRWLDYHRPVATNYECILLDRYYLPSHRRCDVCAAKGLPAYVTSAQANGSRVQIPDLVSPAVI